MVITYNGNMSSIFIDNNKILMNYKRDVILFKNHVKNSEMSNIFLDTTTLKLMKNMVKALTQNPMKSFSK